MTYDMDTSTRVPYFKAESSMAPNVMAQLRVAQAISPGTDTDIWMHFLVNDVDKLKADLMDLENNHVDKLKTDMEDLKMNLDVNTVLDDMYQQLELTKKIGNGIDENLQNTTERVNNWK